MLLNPLTRPVGHPSPDVDRHKRRREDDDDEEQDSPPPPYSRSSQEKDQDLLAAATSAPASSEDPDAAGLRLLSLLLQCAECVAVDNLHDAALLLPEVTELSTPFGSSAQRVGAYFSDALHGRVITSHLGNYSPLTPTPAIHLIKLQNALQTHNSLTPLIKFSHFTANQAILQALQGQEDHVHIIDLDIMQGLQWPGLFQILTSRPKKLKSLRITGLGPSSELLASTGQRLSEFASALNIPFQFTALEGKIGNIDDVSRLNIRPGQETVIVHWMHHCLYDVTGNDLRALRLLTLIRPRLISIVEQDLSHGGSFLGRFVEALHYYSALFDALGDGSGGDGDSVDRHEVERQVFAVEIRNIVAVGGPKRTGEVKIERWGDELSRAGFRPVSLSGSPTKQAGLLLGMFPSSGYTLVEESGSLKLGWKDLSLLTASAWEPNFD